MSYYIIQTRGRNGSTDDRQIDVRGPTEACRALSVAVECLGGASLLEDGKEIMHGHMLGSRCVINWRD